MGKSVSSRWLRLLCAPHLIVNAHIPLGLVQEGQVKHLFSIWLWQGECRKTFSFPDGQNKYDYSLHSTFIYFSGLKLHWHRFIRILHCFHHLTHEAVIINYFSCVYEVKIPKQDLFIPDLLNETRFFWTEDSSIKDFRTQGHDT